MDLGTPPESGGETLNAFIEKVNQINSEMFPLLDQEGWLSMRNEWKDGVVEIQAYLSFQHDGILKIFFNQQLRHRRIKQSFFLTSKRISHYPEHDS